LRRYRAGKLYHSGRISCSGKQISLQEVINARVEILRRKLESRELLAPVIDGARHARPSVLATVTMMTLTSGGDGK
jgi:hypothetical protein